MIVFTQNLRESLNQWLRETAYDKVFILTDTHTHSFCLHYLTDLVSEQNTIVIPNGELSKNLVSANIIWEHLVINGASRKSLLVNLGGGMVTDLGGFCASVFQRGIDFINIPTSLLAMVDASVGGKNGIDFGNLKNYIGTISQPKLVLIDPVFLKTLPEIDILNGWAEILKHGIIGGLNSWNLCKEIPTIQAIDSWFHIIQNNVETKNKIVEKDPFEKNIRKKLNLGHTVGHAFESYFMHDKIPMRHGFCVAEGILIEAEIAANKHLIPMPDLLEIQSRIRAFFPFINIQIALIPKLIQTIKSDKKNHHDSIRMSLPAGIGEVLTDIEVSELEIETALTKHITNANKA